MGHVRRITAKDKCNNAAKKAGDILSVFGFGSTGEAVQYYLRRRKRGAEIWLVYAGGLNLNLSINSNYYPRTYASARKYMAKHFGLPEKSKRKRPKLALVKGGKTE